LTSAVARSRRAPLPEEDCAINANASGDIGLRSFLPPRLVEAVEPYRRVLRPRLTRKFARAGAVEEFVASFRPDERILNVGAGTTDYGPNVVNLDIRPAPTVHVVAPAEAMPLADASFEAVLMQAMLQQVDDVHRSLDEVRRVLKPSGRLLVEVPFIQGVSAPLDSRRFTEAGLRRELERHGFAVEETGVAVGPASALAWVLADVLALAVSVRSANGYRIARLVTTFVAWPVKFLDVALDRHPMAHVIASGVWASARKPA
jgi:SAM-dependent methyltransferase